MAEVVVQLKLNQVRTREPVSVNVRVAFEQGEGERGASEQDVRSVGDVIIGSVNVLAELDPSNEYVIHIHKDSTGLDLLSFRLYSHTYDGI